jgi:hypothetical protein
MLQDLYAVYPAESHAVLARALIQARKNIAAPAVPDAIEQEAGRLLGLWREIRVHRSRS